MTTHKDESISRKFGDKVEHAGNEISGKAPKIRRVMNNLGTKIGYMNDKKSRTADSTKAFQNIVDNLNGKVGVPILLYILGVPGLLVILIWFFFFRGS